MSSVTRLHNPLNTLNYSIAVVLIHPLQFAGVVAGEMAVGALGLSSTGRVGCRSRTVVAFGRESVMGLQRWPSCSA